MIIVPDIISAAPIKDSVSAESPNNTICMKNASAVSKFLTSDAEAALSYFNAKFMATQTIGRQMLQITRSILGV